MRSARVQISRGRIGIARVMLLIPFVFLGLRAAHLSADHRGRARGIDQTQTLLKLAPERGAIVDAAGVELALSVDSPSIYAVPSQIRDISAAAARLAPIIGWSQARLVERLEDHQSFLFLSRWVTSERAQRAAELGIAGVGVLDEPRRIYPHRHLASRLIGFANIDGAGVRGIEQQEDEWLRGVERRIPVERDARGRKIWLSGTEPWDTSGGAVALTIDATLQAIAEEALRESVESTGALGGVVVAMDPWSGDILTLAENPGFDPNHFRKVPFAATRSQAFLDAMDPGSTLKAFLIAAAIENGSVSDSDRFDGEEGAFRVPGKIITDTHPNDDVMSVADIMRVSSNIGAVKIAYRIGAGPHHDMLREFGFGASTRSRFPGESAGQMRPWQKWRPLDHATIAFGQGIAVTPIQLAAATSALANGGLLVQPRLVSARRAPGERWHSTPGQIVRRVVSERTAAQVLEMMEGVVGPTGTASRAGLRGLRVAGKTGTAQKWDTEARTYSKDRHVSWFIGVVPADDPKLVVVVGVDEPRRPAHTGGMTAAPLFAKVAASQLTRFGIATEPERRLTPVPASTPHIAVASNDPTEPPAVATEPPTTPVPAEANTLVARRDAPDPTPRRSVEPATQRVPDPLARLDDRVLLPDFLGLTVDEVRQISEGAALAVKISGRGRAVQQDPPAGTVVTASAGSVHVLFEAAPLRAEGDS